ncbi:MAG TPA: antitoxin family protein [Gemmataceae bacterium]|nr:antitoxin family protein [Gemmataceae bacterium]
MTAHFTAVYEGGLLRPSVPLPLEEGTQVEVIVLQSPQGISTPQASDILATIAALPSAVGDPFTSRDHDQVLYGDRGAR